MHATELGGSIQSPVGEVISYREAIAETIKRAIPMAMSFTFSFSVALIGPMATHFSGDEEERSLNLAAASLITTLTNSVAFIASSALFAVAAISSEAVGESASDDLEAGLSEEQYSDAAKEKTAQAFRSGLCWSIPASAVGFSVLYFSKAILIGLGQDEAVSDRAQDFLRPYAFSMPFFLSRMLLEQVMFAYKQERRVMWLALASFLLIGLPVTFSLAFRDLVGFKGVAIGFLSDSVLLSFLLFANLKFSHVYKDIPFLGLPKWEEFTRFLKMGASFSSQIASEQAAFFVLNILIGHLGTTQLAAQNFSLQLIFIAIIFQLSIAHSSAQAMMRSEGGGKMAQASLFARSGLAVNVVSNFAISLVLVGALYTFASRQESFGYAKYLLPISIVIQCLETAHYTSTTQLRYLNKVLKPVLISSGSRWLGVLLGFGLGRAGWKVYGVNAGYATGLFLGFAAVLHGYWKTRTDEQAFSNRYQPVS